MEFYDVLTRCYDGKNGAGADYPDKVRPINRNKCPLFLITIL